eukprot:13785319-Alexandrium_andersonii.AAC.1
MPSRGDGGATIFITRTTAITTAITTAWHHCTCHVSGGMPRDVGFQLQWPGWLGGAVLRGGGSQA